MDSSPATPVHVSEHPFLSNFQPSGARVFPEDTLIVCLGSDHAGDLNAFFLMFRSPLKSMQKLKALGFSHTGTETSQHPPGNVELQGKKTSSQTVWWVKLVLYCKNK